MVWVIRVILKDQWLLFNDGMTLLADILAQATGFLTVMAWATQVPKVRRGERRTKCRGVKKESAASNNAMTYFVTAT